MAQQFALTDDTPTYNPRYADAFVVFAVTVLSLAIGVWCLLRLGFALWMGTAAALAAYAVLLSVHLAVRRSLVAADDHLYVHYADGTMTLVKASPASLEEVGHFEVPGSGERPSWSHPVILDGQLYVREGDVILCYDVRK